MDSVFIDTSVVEQYNFDVTAAPFKVLAELAAHGTVRVVTTDITLREIDSRIDEHVAKARAALKEAAKRSQVIKNVKSSEYQAVFKKLDHDAHASVIKKKVRDYFASAGFETIKASSMDAQPIFDAYFEGRPPFGEGNKKSEFPDAFVMAAVEKWAKENETQLIVVSRDGDFADACTNSKIECTDALPGVTEKFLQAKLVGDVRAAFRHNPQVLVPYVQTALDNSVLISMDAPDGDVESVEVLDVDVEEVYVVKADRGSATLDFYAWITVKARINHGDESTRWYDSEDKRGGYLERITTEVERDLDLPTEAQIRFSGDPSNFEVVDLVINRGEAIEVPFYEDR